MRGMIPTLTKAGLLAGALSCLALAGARADELFSSSGGAGVSAAFRVLDGRAASQYAGSVKYRPDYREGTVAGIPPWTGTYAGAYLQIARTAARDNGIPEDLFLRLVEQESRWNDRAESHKGALGLAQLMPETAMRLGVDPMNPADNLAGGARYLREQYDRFRDWRLALAAYNAGPEAVERYDGVPPYAETEGYVLAILGR